MANIWIRVELCYIATLWLVTRGYSSNIHSNTVHHHLSPSSLTAYYHTHLTLYNYTIYSFVICDRESIPARVLAAHNSAGVWGGTSRSAQGEGETERCVWVSDSRVQVLQIFREVETAKEVKLGLCREHRAQLIWEEEGGPGGPAPGRGLRRKLSCLSPIVESVADVGGGGRDSALGTSNSGTASGSQEPDRWGAAINI